MLEPVIADGAPAQLGTPFSLYDCWEQKVFEWTPIAHIDWFEAVKANLPKPSYEWYPCIIGQGPFVVMDRDQFAVSVDAEQQRLISLQSLLLLDDRTSNRNSYEFNEALLLKLVGGNRRRIIEIYDYSIDEDDDNACHRKGTMQTILEACGMKGRILNALDLPNPTRTLANDSLGLASCFKTWCSIYKPPFMDVKAAYPSVSLAWFLVALAGAFTYWHLDSNGLLTRIRVLTGKRLWIIAEYEDLKLSDIDLFTQDDYSNFGMNTKILKLHPIVLTPGMEFVMRPGVLHMVITLEDSLLHYLSWLC
ncbi:hypothetical protein NP233_g11988 [Leucocoprinus birnbaumii]|uniref:JmjC domain-containing protein n=1 Tax=Leucocoprinus birnbaumii TaxID=56174 RepID=A0AAD5VH47_9AGAR|nr:hypothetical protein NP233_g11988 [Leucocoprinus birnbaumii]